MQKGLLKKTGLEHVIKKESIDIGYIQETHLKKEIIQNEKKEHIEEKKERRGEY